MTDAITFQISISLMGEQNVLDVIPHTDKDQAIYEVKGANLSCAVGRNEDGKWEANNDTDESIVQAIGKAIDEAEINLPK